MSSAPLAIDPPSKVIAVGLNYRDHVIESGATVPTHPMLFAKWPSCLVGDGAQILIPAGVGSVDWEAELGVVIDREVRDASVDDALGFVRGYVCANDISAREVQAADGQWTRGKSFDSFGPIGPRLVPASEIPDPQSLGITCRINGETVQESNTSEMVFGVAELIAFITRSTTLLAGDLIITGTPGGVGAGRTPPRFMSDGDVVEVEIESVGLLRNDVRAAGAPTPRVVSGTKAGA